MRSDIAKLKKEVTNRINEYKKVAPEVAKSFWGLIQTCEKNRGLDLKVKELIALAIAISSRCDDCIVAHIPTYIKAGGTREELLEMIGVAVYMGGGPAMMYGTHALQAFDEN